MINLGPLNMIPVVRVIDKASKGELKSRRRNAKDYDPETSVYNNRTEHDICTAILNWNKA